MINRRQFTRQSLAAVTSFAFVESLFAFDAFRPAIRTDMSKWLKGLNTYCGDLKKESITGQEWQALVGDLFDQIDLTELLQFIDFDQLIKGFKYPDLGVNTRPIKFPTLAGLPDDLVFTRKIFGMQKDRAIIPHGHSNMASAHLILEGELHLRHYDKVSTESRHLIIAPTIDKMVCPGDYSSISNEKDNIHWFVANTKKAFTFDVIMLDLAGKPYDIHNLDMDASEELSDGTLRVPVVEVGEALMKYGKNSHH
jgi:hypothetical protein